MKQHSFYSHFADHILRFIEYKNNLGCLSSALNVTSEKSSAMIDFPPTNLLSKQKKPTVFLSDADQTSFFKTIGFLCFIQKSAQIFYLHA